jgi:nucleotide-binding universal stress UspA family protein
MTQSPFHIKQILFPTDFSRSSESAASHVAGFAKEVGAKVAILNVVSWLAGWHGKSEPHFIFSDNVLKELALNEQDIEAACLKRLEAFKEQHFQNLECNLCIRTGGVAESIAEYAQEIETDLVMMPTRGGWPPRRFLIGSVTAKVLHDVRCAVWTSPHPAELEPFRPYRQIVCAMDYRLLSRDLLARASEVATVFQSRLSVMTAIPCPAISLVPCAERESVRSLKNESVSALKHLLRDLSLDASLHVLEGTVGEAVRQTLAMEDGDLVVIGRGHLDEPFGHLRTHAYEIIWNSPCPVLSV